MRVITAGFKATIRAAREALMYCKPLKKKKLYEKMPQNPSSVTTNV